MIPWVGILLLYEARSTQRGKLHGVYLTEQFCESKLLQHCSFFFLPTLVNDSSMACGRIFCRPSIALPDYGYTEKTASVYNVCRQGLKTPSYQIGKSFKTGLAGSEVKSEVGAIDVHVNMCPRVRGAPTRANC